MLFLVEYWATKRRNSKLKPWSIAISNCGTQSYTSTLTTVVWFLGDVRWKKECT